jgi:AcrR family transcriptional regulator
VIIFIKILTDTSVSTKEECDLKQILGTAKMVDGQPNNDNDPHRTKRGKNRRINKSREERLDELFRASREVLTEKGVNSFKVKDVADKIGIGRGTLYEFIQTKNDIVFLALERLINEAIRNLQDRTNDSTDPLVTLKAAIRSHLEFISINPKMLWALYQLSTPISKSQFKKIFKLIDRYNGIFKALIEKGCQDGIFYVDDPYLVAHSITTMLNTWVIKKNYLNYNFDIEDYEKKMCQVILQGLLDLNGEKAMRNLERFKAL